MTTKEPTFRVSDGKDDDCLGGAVPAAAFLQLVATKPLSDLAVGESTTATRWGVVYKITRVS